MPTVTCESCGKQFDKSLSRIKRDNHHYCGVDCLNSSRARPVETKTCEYCQETLKESSARRGLKYCSVRCAKLHRSQLATTTLTCEHCGKTFTRRRRVMSPNNYCSLKCANLAKDSSVERICPICGKVLRMHPSLAKDVNYCSKQCLGKSQQRRVTCTCKNCGKTFERTALRASHPKSGNFCSQSCSTVYNLANCGKKRTDIEIAIENALIEMGVKYQAQRPIARFVCDFYIKPHRLVIECDGSYWHDRPEQKEKDNAKDAWLIAHTFKVLRLTDKEILGDIERCKQRILEAMNRKGTHEQLSLLRLGN